MKQVHFVEAPNNFYLGARVDPATNEVIEDQPVYYDARDLSTHGVILGMTGSGKTGLGISLLEEAAIDGIPQLIIGPVQQTKNGTGTRACVTRWIGLSAFRRDQLRRAAAARGDDRQA